MKKRLLVIIALALTAALLSGCAALSLLFTARTGVKQVETRTAEPMMDVMYEDSMSYMMPMGTAMPLAGSAMNGLMVEMNTEEKLTSRLMRVP